MFRHSFHDLMNLYINRNRSIRRVDIESIIIHVTKKSREFIYTYPTYPVTIKQKKLLHKLFLELQNGKPISYIVGETEFWSIKLLVSKGILIPRPDTETIVETVLDLYENNFIKLLELGTGSGAVSIALKKERKHWSILGTDISKKCIRCAKQNAHMNNIKGINFTVSDWFENIGNEKFHIIISNPPYLCKKDKCIDQSVLKWEPHHALFSRKRGLADIEKIIKNSTSHLKKTGMLILEHGFKQSFEVRKIFMRYGYFHIKHIRDLNKNIRVTLGVFG